MTEFSCTVEKLKKDMVILLVWPSKISISSSDLMPEMVSMISKQTCFCICIHFLGPTVIRSSKEVMSDQWVVISASRTPSEGKLIVNGDAPVSGKSKGNSRVLNLQTPLYVGGYDKSAVKVNQGVGVNTGFTGCISDVSIYDSLLR